MKTVFGMLFKVVSTVLLLSIAGLFLASMFPVPGNIQTKIVQSGSMEPAIHVGALIVIKPQDSYEVGDVITFGADTRREIPTTHRVTAVRQASGGPWYTTKGDANEEDDGDEVSHRQVIGRVLVDIPYVGFVLDFAKQPVGFVLLVVLPAGAIILDEIIVIWRELSKRSRKQEEHNSYDTP